ncbi:hypothetical protein AZL_020180 [Azospirillum sp. B510]|uniref:phage Gp37/Gp68 family protein n=1 Tax=Azospirillum sp. (strain B510) TaxID=137722 RepID=UPI0001C4C372|nr:phage Gp37/Gp68 family protein [Azospirillum sp. B510]BAI71499.1 phage Gp37Gp68 [Azospirillum sp. B510]BAI72656.1 hypothetical protein AZL_020180 [Azospirillum sp. B510]
MAERSVIEWTDHTWTPIVGCTAKSPACANCYAAPMAARLEAMGMAKYAGLATRSGGRGKWTGKVNLSEADVLAPLNKRRPARWFLTSMGDVFHEAVPDEFLDRLFAVMALGSRHTFQVLTKRPERAAQYLNTPDRVWKLFGSVRKHIDDEYREGSRWEEDETPFPWPLPNVLIGCTAEDQARANERHPHMLRIAAAGWNTFVSYEPALGLVDWTGWQFLKWLISGGESGHGARPSHPDWHRAARDFCAAHGIPYMFKQWGEWAPRRQAERDDLLDARRSVIVKPDGGITSGLMAYGSDAWVLDRLGKKAAGRLLDGQLWDGVPVLKGGA